MYVVRSSFEISSLKFLYKFVPNVLNWCILNCLFFGCSNKKIVVFLFNYIIWYNYSISCY